MSLRPHAWLQPGSLRLVPGFGQKGASGGAGRRALQSSIFREVHRQVMLLWPEPYWLLEELHVTVELLPLIPLSPPC